MSFSGLLDIRPANDSQKRFHNQHLNSSQPSQLETQCEGLSSQSVPVCSPHFPPGKFCHHRAGQNTQMCPVHAERFRKESQQQKDIKTEIRGHSSVELFDSAGLFAFHSVCTD